jgi:hypothetical protein
MCRIRLRAERKLGDFLTTTARVRGRPKSVPQVNTLPRLSDFGITDRKLSHRAQRLAAISAAEFERYLKSAREREWEITTRQLLYLCERRQAARKNRQRIVGGHVSDLVEFARFGNRMGTILIDPPWATLNALLPYSSITPDELQSLPIPALSRRAVPSSHVGDREQLRLRCEGRDRGLGGFELSETSFALNRSLVAEIIGGSHMKSC